MPSEIVRARKGMIEVLGEIVVPALERKGFTGDFPHFRRITPERIDLLSFFFNPYGHGFVFKFGRCGPDGFVKRSGKRVPPNKVTTGDMPYMQLNWISPDIASTGPAFWFQYEPGSLGSLRRAAECSLPYLLQVDL